MEGYNCLGSEREISHPGGVQWNSEQAGLLFSCAQNDSCCPSICRSPEKGGATAFPQADAIPGRRRPHPIFPWSRWGGGGMVLRRRRRCTASCASSWGCRHILVSHMSCRAAAQPSALMESTLLQHSEKRVVQRTMQLLPSNIQQADVHFVFRKVQPLAT